MEGEPSRREAQAEAGVSGDVVKPSEEDVAAASLDVSSESFDPLLALYSPQTPLPYPDVRCFNNLAEYESFLRGGGRAQRRPEGRSARRGRKPAPDPERAERLKKLMVAPGPEEAQRAKPPRRGRRAPKNVLTRMPLLQGGPLGALHRCVQEHLKLNVHIRTFKGLRGVCSGFLLAFDKFWNMVMVDVDETYRKPILGQAFHHEPKLNLTLLFQRLKLQESAAQSCPETQRAAKKPPAVLPPHPAAPHSGSRGGKSSSGEPGGSSHPPIRGTTPQGQDTTGTKPKKEKVDYQRVFTRHMKQVFIRGENILLIHLPQ